MSYVMTNTEMAVKCRKIAEQNKTVYVWGAWGQECTKDFIEEKARQYAKTDHFTPDKVGYMLDCAKKGDYWCFDCNGLIKALIWGWNGSPDPYHRGGAKYQGNSFTDTNATGLMSRCSNVTTSFDNICVGELVYKPGHIGIYIGNGVVAEATPAWKNGVQYSNLSNVKGWDNRIANDRMWTKHGKLRAIDYTLRVNSLVDFVGKEIRVTPSGPVTIPYHKGIVRVSQIIPNEEFGVHIVLDLWGTTHACGWVSRSDLAL